MMDLTADAPAPPKLADAAYDRVRAVLAASGPAAAADALVAEQERADDLGGLFYALLLKKRVELGVSPFPTGPSTELPPETHEPYEAAIRDAGRLVGHRALARGDFSKAWAFFRMIDEPGPVRDALAAVEPGPDADIYPLVEIAWQNGVLPKKGFDLILDRHGVCSAITMVGSSDLNSNPDLRDYCVSRLVRALHAQLADRLRADLLGRGLPAPEGASVPQLLAADGELLGEDSYHIDVSHLSSVVGMAVHLPPGADLDLARELAAYGCRLAPSLQGNNEPPFEDNYADHLAFLNVLAGVDVDAGLERFRAKAEREFADGVTYPAQVYVNLLVKAGRLREAFDAARAYLPADDERNLSCPGVTELARRLGDFEAVAEAGRARDDAVQFLAGLIAARNLH